jgi:hypothetical protein
MKPTPIFKIEHRIARHDGRAPSNRAFPAIECFFRPETDTTLGRAGRRPSDGARRSFRRMTLDMLAKHERIDPLELTVFVVVIAIIAWPLVSLLIVLAQTASG